MASFSQDLNPADSSSDADERLVDPGVLLPLLELYAHSDEERVDLVLQDLQIRMLREELHTVLKTNKKGNYTFLFVYIF